MIELQLVSTYFMVSSCLYFGIIVLGPVHTAPFLYKNGEKKLRFCESVHIDLHKNATKTEVFENAIESEYPQKRRFLKTQLINVNAQKRRFSKTLLYLTMSFTKTEQCERTKTDVFRCTFVIRQISVNAQKRRIFNSFLYKNGAV